MEFDRRSEHYNNIEFEEKCEVKYASTVIKREKKKKKGGVTPTCCVICLENDSNAVVLNCGHGGICHDCGKRLLHKAQADQRVCHLCREPIAYLLKMDLDKVVNEFIKVVTVTYVKTMNGVVVRDSEE